MAEKKAESKEKKLGKEIGRMSHYFSKIRVGVIELTSALKVGDEIRIKGATTDFEQKVDSMQIDHENVESAKKGQGIGLKTAEPVREGDKVYKV